MNQIERKNTNSGFIATILLIVISLIVVGYFFPNIKQIIGKPVVIDAFNYITGLATEIWLKIFQKPVNFIWHKIIIELIWTNLLKIVHFAQNLINK